ncbi:hypothetical protein I4F81_002339 [Pyropia yezoensis]|uniref:Uncharacterized protein n=1 Tax=Pyropia yezoensis TaxID=2788 RepID=A0ACC3BPS5_PYRYE|nr:hypothetical protein I4F81_002339 [Neopyropia yezoensis]
MVVGAKGAGKSMAVRYIVNALLGGGGAPRGVVLVDADVGQPEAGPPGVVGATVVTAPLLGGPPAHNRGRGGVWVGDVAARGDGRGVAAAVRRAVAAGLALATSGGGDGSGEAPPNGPGIPAAAVAVVGAAVAVGVVAARGVVRVPTAEAAAAAATPRRRSPPGTNFHSIAYAPFQGSPGRTCPPFRPADGGDFCLPPERVAADMARLHALTPRVRTYSAVCDAANRVIYDAARAGGMTVDAGVWVGADAAAVDREVALIGAALADGYGDVIRTIWRRWAPSPFPGGADYAWGLLDCARGDKGGGVPPPTQGV